MRTSRWLLVYPVSSVLLTYVGYPAILAVVSRRLAQRRATAQFRGMIGHEPAISELPALTVVVAAYNEEQVIEQKVADLRRQEYPGRVRIIVVTDGSTDSTPRRALAAGAEVLHDRNRAGKSAAVNRGLWAADTDLVVLTDANCRLAPGALHSLATEFADPRVAVVGGVKSVGGNSTQGRGEGLYWRFETAIKMAESELGVVPGAVGELVALRRTAVHPIPPGVVNDDYHLACAALADGYLVRCAERARTYEAGSVSAADELERRTRVAAGSWQTTLAHLRLLDPRRGHVSWVFAGHRVLRTLVTPASLPVLLLTSAWQSRPTSRSADVRAARALLAVQVLLYGGAIASLRSESRVLAVPYAFGSTNLATLRGGVRHLLGRQPVAWERVDRVVDLTDIAVPDDGRHRALPSA